MGFTEFVASNDAREFIFLARDVTKMHSIVMLLSFLYSNTLSTKKEQLPDINTSQGVRQIDNTQ
jgi:hypothetical protein